MPRRRKTILVGEQSVLKRFDWSVDPQTMGEIVGVGMVLTGLLVVLSIFGLAGRVGDRVFEGLTNLFGLASFLIPLVLLVFGGHVFKNASVQLRGTTLVGLVMGLLFVPALFGLFSAGGAVGAAISTIFRQSIGSVGALVLSVGLAVIAGLLSTNTSLKTLRGWLGGQLGSHPSSPIKVNTAGVPIFNMGRARLKTQPSVPETTSATIKRPQLVPESWQLPSTDLLELSATRAVPGNITKNVDVIAKNLADFGIEVTMGDVNVGPTVTQYTLKPAEGVKLAAIVARANDLALALAAHPIRVEAPIPGKSAVGIEVPNKQPALVTLREVLETADFQQARSNLALALGRDVAGEPIIADLAKMPHLLIAGATGSGKSVCINGLILSLLYANSPSSLRLLLVDPKRVEFTMYNGIPQLLAPVVHDVDKTINALRWAIAEMERRFQLFSERHKRNLEEYNSDPDPEEGILTYIVVVIDELADLMTQASSEVEAAIVRLAQMARATGIHLVVATQRPSVDVITGLIKANITTRIAFAVASQIDSRTIIDQAGAEKLLGNGDMLYLSSDFGKPKRVQGVYMKEKEIKAVTEFLRSQSSPSYDDSILTYHPRGVRLGGEVVIDDELFDEAKQVVVSAGKGSASLLQRRLRIGYARAARLLDLLEQEGIVGPEQGGKPREVLVGASDRLGETQEI